VALLLKLDIVAFNPLTWAIINGHSRVAEILISTGTLLQHTLPGFAGCVEVEQQFLSENVSIPFIVKTELPKIEKIEKRSSGNLNFGGSVSWSRNMSGSRKKKGVGCRKNRMSQKNRKVWKARRRLSRCRAEKRKKGVFGGNGIGKIRKTDQKDYKVVKYSDIRKEVNSSGDGKIY